MEYLAFNPNYKLRQDGNRVILYGEESEIYKSQDWFSFIHPFHAMLISCFNGRLPLKHEIKFCSDFFHKDQAFIHNLIKPFIQNKDWIKYKCSNGLIESFPKNLFVVSDSPLERVSIYSPFDFKYIGTPDLETNRLSFPLNINLELTMECMTNCCYCYADRSKLKKKQLSTERILELIKEARIKGVNNFDINGGEVLLHKDIKLILKTLIENKFNPLVSTKMPVDIEMIRFFKNIGLTKFQISLDSTDDEVLKKMVGMPKGYFDKIRNSLKTAENLGVEVIINTVLTNLNSSSEEIEKLLKFTSGFSNIKTHRLNPFGYSLYKNTFKRYCTDSKNLEQIQQSCPEWEKRYGIRIPFSGYDCKQMFELEQKRLSFPKRAICTGNVWNLVILPDGDVTICEELYHNPNFIIGNVKFHSIEEVWNGEKALKLYKDPLSNNSESTCRSCEEYEICRQGQGVCWKTIMMAYGKSNWDFPDPRCPKAETPYFKYYY